MNVQSIGQGMLSGGCQPIRSFGALSQPAPNFKAKEAEYRDAFSLSPKEINLASAYNRLAQKYDFSCRMTALAQQERDIYKAKYENLKMGMDCAV